MSLSWPTQRGSLLRSPRPGPLMVETALPSLRASRISSRTTELASAVGVTMRTKCCSAFDLKASSIWLHQSRPLSSATMSCQIRERFSASSFLRNSVASSPPSLRE
jgi:hypothetical protein